MIHCKELSDKVVRLLTIYEDGTYGPEVHIEFTDGTTFSACLKTNVSIEARYIHDQAASQLFSEITRLRSRVDLKRWDLDNTRHFILADSGRRSL
ncbi:hypothetical protein ACPOL_3112 [Acidisarcina polymorpha]|uniref:Uncharacterized protein n=1 Tax=Acidisarcina polymorpha TaxID=2211140 RepID=A0A2Z5G121_9BACT|nr:hypothetical protein [Acidisarcina polymorpha]AXC12407.1 hypothetical protein ACPOL_3112 [Acidisarcina polymorpha]